MTTPRGEAGVRKAGSARAAEGVRQLSSRTARDTHHEDRVEDTLAAYYTAAGHAERIRVAARRKAARVLTTARLKARAITAAAERDAAAPDAEAAGFLRELHGLVGGRAEVAELCGLSVKAVTAILARPEPAAAPAGAGEDGTASGGEDDGGETGNGRAGTEAGG